jgi:hypothetical protein
MQESQFDKLLGLCQTAVSWAIYVQEAVAMSMLVVATFRMQG